MWPFLDQDVLNLILDKKFIIVEKRYNYECSLSRLIDDADKPSEVVIDKNKVTVLHYIGARSHGILGYSVALLRNFG